MRRVADDKIICCPLCGTVMRERAYEMLMKRDNGKRLIQFTLWCPNTGCETELTHTTFMEYDRNEDQMALTSGEI